MRDVLFKLNSKHGRGTWNWDYTDMLTEVSMPPGGVVS